VGHGVPVAQWGRIFPKLGNVVNPKMGKNEIVAVKYNLNLSGRRASGGTDGTYDRASRPKRLRCR
jgi:hypothetical protein